MISTWGTIKSFEREAVALSVYETIPGLLLQTPDCVAVIGLPTSALEPSLESRCALVVTPSASAAFVRDVRNGRFDR